MSIAVIAVRPRLLINAPEHCHSKRHSNRSLFMQHNFSHSSEVVDVLCNMQWGKTTFSRSAGMVVEGAHQLLSDVNAVTKGIISVFVSVITKKQRGEDPSFQADWCLTLIAMCFNRLCHLWITVYPVFSRVALAFPPVSILLQWLCLSWELGLQAF